jgi:hypothetical protein
MKYKHSSLLLARLTSAFFGFHRLSSDFFGSLRHGTLETRFLHGVACHNIIRRQSWKLCHQEPKTHTQPPYLGQLRRTEGVVPPISSPPEPYRKQTHFVGSEVLTAVTKKNTLILDVTPCSLIDIYRRFGRTYSLSLQGWRINHTACLLLTWSALRPWRWRQFLRNVCKQTARNHVAEDITLHYFVCCSRTHLGLMSGYCSHSECHARRLVTGFPPWRPGFEPGSGNVGFMVDKVAPGQVFSEYFGFSCQSLFHQLLYSHHRVSSGAGTIGQQWPQYQVDSVSPH